MRHALGVVQAAVVFDGPRSSFRGVPTFDLAILVPQQEPMPSDYPFWIVELRRVPRDMPAAVRNAPLPFRLGEPTPKSSPEVLRVAWEEAWRALTAITCLRDSYEVDRADSQRRSGYAWRKTTMNQWRFSATSIHQARIKNMQL